MQIKYLASIVSFKSLASGLKLLGLRRYSV